MTTWPVYRLELACMLKWREIDGLRETLSQGYVYEEVVEPHLSVDDPERSQQWDQNGSNLRNPAEGREDRSGGRTQPTGACRLPTLPTSPTETRDYYDPFVSPRKSVSWSPNLTEVRMLDNNANNVKHFSYTIVLLRGRQTGIVNNLTLRLSVWRGTQTTQRMTTWTSCRGRSVSHPNWWRWLFGAVSVIRTVKWWRWALRMRKRRV